MPLVSKLNSSVIHLISIPWARHPCEAGILGLHLMDAKTEAHGICFANWYYNWGFGVYSGVFQFFMIFLQAVVHILPQILENVEVSSPGKCLCSGPQRWLTQLELCPLSRKNQGMMARRPFICKNCKGPSMWRLLVGSFLNSIAWWLTGGRGGRERHTYRVEERKGAGKRQTEGETERGREREEKIKVHLYRIMLANKYRREGKMRQSPQTQHNDEFR